MSKSRHRVAAVSALDEDGDRVIREIGGREIAVFNVDGEHYAMLNYCVHVGGPLCEGEIVNPIGLDDDGFTWAYETDRKVVQCPWHGWQFDITSGQSVESEMYSVPTYDVEVSGDDVYVLL